MSRGSGCGADEHVGRRQINLDCEDPAPDADMDEDECADYQLHDDSYPAPSQSYPGGDPGFAHQSWEHEELQTQGGKKRKHQERSEGSEEQKRIKLWPNRPFTRSGNAQQSTAQSQTLAWGGNANLAAVANAKQEATAASTGAAGAATADGQAKQAAAGEAKQAAGPDAAAPATSEESSAIAGFAKSSYGSSVVQAAVRASPGVLSNYQFSC